MSNVQKIVRATTRWDDEEGRHLLLEDLERFVEQIRDEGASGDSLIDVREGSEDSDIDVVLEWVK